MSMTLEAWRKEKSLTLEALAAELGVTGNGAVRTVQRYTKHERIPSWSTIRLIEQVTGGAVTRDSFPDEPVRKQSRVAA